MALIKYGGGVASMSGKQGGAVHGRGRTGATIRDWTKPCNPANAKQSQARARFAQQSSGWGNLTDAQRDAWNAFAQTSARANRQGDIYVPTGRQLYVELNGYLKLAQQGAITDPPVGLVPPTIKDDLQIAIEEISDTLTLFDITDGAADATVKWLVYAAPPQMTGRNNVNRQMRFLGPFDPAAAVSIDAAYIAVFGDLVPLGARLQIQLQAVGMTTGLSSTVLTILGTAVAG